MNALLESPWLKDLGWVLVHSLWQGAILWALLALVFAVGRRSLSAAVKHRMAWLTLTALALAPVVTMIWLQSQKKTPEAAPSSQVIAAPSVSSASSPSPSAFQSDTATSPTAPLIPPRPSDSFASSSKPTSWVKQLPVFLAVAWMIGLVCLILRLLVGWYWVKRLRHTGVTPDAAWRTRFLEWSSRATLRGVRVLVSPTLGVPLVVGWLRPVICFPASLLSRLSIAEVEALMLHELAHLKRRDPLLQFWVTVVETLLFHNPAAHALARTVRQTGELACDDLVLQWQGDGKTYARALAAAEEWRGSQFALAATGAGSLKHRIQRILGLGEHGRLSSLPERFGITSVAGIALYFIVCGFAVPRIASALTPEERVSVINQEREALQITSANAAPRELEAVGAVRMKDSSKPSEDFTIVAWSQNYTAFYTVSAPGEKQTVLGRGDRMAVGAWIPGYAPSMTPVSFSTHNKDRGTFDLVVESGFPAIIKLVDKGGNPIPGATITCTALLAPDRDLYDIYHQGKLSTDATGTCIPGNALEGQSFRLDVRAFGFQWLRFEDVQFKKDTSTTLTLINSTPIAGTVVDARNQKPIPGANALCMMRRRNNGTFSHGYGYGLTPRMNASASDDNGRLELNICHPDDEYQIILEAPGYGRKAVVQSGQSSGFRFALEPELVVSGVIEDPEKKLRRNNSKVSVELENEVGEERTHIQISQEFAPDAEGRIPFKFNQVSSGKISLRPYHVDAAWETEQQSSIEGLVFRVEGKTLKCVSGPENIVTKAGATRPVELVFKSPQGSPPYNGEVALSMGSPITFHKVVNGICKVDAPIGTGLNVFPAGITGYRFETKWAKVEAGEGPFRMEIPMEPAGAISGDLRMYPGFQPSRNEPHLILLKKEQTDGSWRVVNNESGHLIRILDHGSRFFISPVALNATYRIVAYHNTSFAETPEFRLNDSQPLTRRDMIFPEGENVRGTILQPDGTPMEGGSVYLTYKEPDQRVTTANYPVKSDGSFALMRMNFDITGQYFLSVPATRGVAPLIARLDGESSNVRLQRQAGHTVEGELVDPNGAPVSGVKLRFVPTEIATQSSFIDVGDSITSDASDASGHFRISTFPPGEYRAYLDDWKYDWAGVGANTVDFPGRLVRVPASVGTVYRFQIKKR